MNRTSDPKHSYYVAMQAAAKDLNPDVVATPAGVISSETFLARQEELRL